MTTRAHECLMRMYQEEHNLEDYQGSIRRVLLERLPAAMKEPLR